MAPLKGNYSEALWLKLVLKLVNYAVINGTS